MKPKVLSPQKIREMARAHLKESEDFESKNRLQRKFPTSFNQLENSQDPAAQDVDFEDASETDDHKLEFQFGAFEKARTDSVFMVFLQDDSDGGEEMRQLCETLGMQVVDTHVVSVNQARKASPSTFLGSGNLDKIRDRMQRAGAAALVIDAKLSPVQVRNMEDILKTPVLDREGVILEIFHHHAKSSLAKLQVELARLKYLQPRLSGIWSGLSRQRGAKGGLGGRGLGESRLELDRRVIKNRITVLQKKLKEAEKAFRTQSSRRAGLPRVALVGYTNAGKSTLMRLLTKADVEVEDKLFSTLDTTVRPLLPPTEPKILISDTVGFVRNLPHDLVASFKSTLREALESQLVLHVLDASHPLWREHFESTEAVLDEVGAAELPKLLILNKIDRLGGVSRLREAEVRRFLRNYEKYDRVIAVSALDTAYLPTLRENLIEVLGVESPAWIQQKETNDD